MKKLFIIAAVVSGLFIVSCRKIEVDGDGTGTGTTGDDSEVVLVDSITTNTTLDDATKTYLIRGVVYVTNNATLTVAPGITVYGELASKGTLVITRGAKIIAEGTADKPVVFTSEALEANRRSGDWGGIVVLGKATTNASLNGVQGVGSIEGGVNNSKGYGVYGGTDDTDSSGVLKYVRIEYAGFAYLPDNELNSLTLGGVGSKTVVDYVQITYALDDAIECFGGAVNLKHIVTYKTLDDDLDTDNGYKGKVQYAIIMRDSARADVSKSEGFESDNDANGSTLTPQTGAVYSNITCIGPRATLTNVGNSYYLAGAQIRRNSSISIFNSVFMGWPAGILLDDSKGTATSANLTSGSLVLKNITIAGCNSALTYSKGSSVDYGIANWTSWFTDASRNNSILTNSTDAMLTAPFAYTALDFTPQTGSPLIASGAANFSDAKLSGGFFTTTTFRGAVGASGTDATWWKGWTSWK